MSKEYIDKNEAHLILERLDEYYSVLESIAEKSIPPRSRFDVEELQDNLKAIKDQIKSDAKIGALSRCKEPHTRLEEMFLAPTLRKASANFHLKINSNPNTTDWPSAIYAINTEFSYSIFNMRQLLDESQ